MGVSLLDPPKYYRESIQVQYSHAQHSLMHTGKMDTASELPRIISGWVFSPVNIDDTSIIHALSTEFGWCPTRERV